MIRVAQAGIRGVPANYGGSETAVEEIGSRLAAEGVRVVVYCRSHKSPTRDREYRDRCGQRRRAPQGSSRPGCAPGADPLAAALAECAAERPRSSDSEHVADLDETRIAERILEVYRRVAV